MLEFARNIERTVSINRLEQAVEEFQNALSKFNPSNLAGTAEQKELRNLLATTSQRLYQTKEMEMRGGTASDVIQRERTAISNQILDLIYDLDRYPEVSRFLMNEEEDQAWKKATATNSLKSYQDYFSIYPNGKYVAETKRIMEELSSIEENRQNELKQKAEEEKRRREQDAQRQQQQREQQYVPPKKEEPQKPTDNIFQNNIHNTNTITPTSTHVNDVLAIFLIIFSIQPFIGIGAGLYLRHSKTNGNYKFDNASRSKGMAMLIIGCVVALLYFLIRLVSTNF